MNKIVYHILIAMFLQQVICASFRVIPISERINSQMITSSPSYSSSVPNEIYLKEQERSISLTNFNSTSNEEKEKERIPIQMEKVNASNQDCSCKRGHTFVKELNECFPTELLIPSQKVRGIARFNFDQSLDSDSFYANCLTHKIETSNKVKYSSVSQPSDRFNNYALSITPSDFPYLLKSIPIEKERALSIKIQLNLRHHVEEDSHLLEFTPSSFVADSEPVLRMIITNTGKIKWQSGGKTLGSSIPSIKDLNRSYSVNTVINRKGEIQTFVDGVSVSRFLSSKFSTNHYNIRLASRFDGDIDEIGLYSYDQ